ncbi:MAG: DUF4197 domain-containing protein [Hydrogenophaga sp.]|jgi:hypothetical protein|nr:DUF4197 domain-containing protein [Hydrogenophaga sp.]
MQRRQFNHSIVFGTLLLGTYRQAWALSLADLTDQDASRGVKAALEKGALAAVLLLGRPDGFLGNPQVRIPLPGYLNDAARLLKTMGQGKRVDELVTRMNRAAESVVPLGQQQLVGAVRNMSVGDAKSILTGDNDSVTRFFASKTREPLGETFLPLVTQATEKVGLAASYNRLAGRAAGLGLLKQDEANIERYITGKTLDGLYTIIGEEERKIRRDPVSAGSALVKKVFGALK